MFNVVMVRVGDKYGPEYAAILSDMLARNLSELDDVCPWLVTDDPANVPEGINVIPADPRLPGWWQKVRLFSGEMPWKEGERVAFFDLDSIIVDRLEDLIQTKGIIKDWHWDCFNSSVMVWDHGEHRQVWDRFDPTDIPRNIGDQEWITQQAPDFPLLPKAWCVSYRSHAKAFPPEGAKVVCFHGEPKPHRIGEGWVPQFWKVGGLHKLPRLDGMNVSIETALENVRRNVAWSIEHGLPWFKGAAEHGNTAVLVCGGPSMRDHVKDIRARQKMGQRIISVNNTLAFLMERGIRPDAHVILDARPENLRFVENAPDGVQYFLASQCHPSLFEALKDRQVTVWHSMLGEDIVDILGPHESFDRPCLVVPGGGTVGLRSMNLVWASGYRKLHIYGLDGSYEGERHHAYAQGLNDGEHVMDVTMGGRFYRCSKWMVRQAEEFKEAYQTLTEGGMRIMVHGRGLIPDLASTMRERLAA